MVRCFRVFGNDAVYPVTPPRFSLNGYNIFDSGGFPVRFVHDATPAKLPDGDWGAGILVKRGDQLPAAGDGVMITTKDGAELTADIVEVVEVRPRRGGRLFVCELENQEWVD